MRTQEGFGEGQRAELRKEAVRPRNTPLPKISSVLLSPMGIWKSQSQWMGFFLHREMYATIMD